MKFFDTTLKNQGYEIGFQVSLLHEAALGIAAVTYPDIHQTLDKEHLYWEQARPFSKGLQVELDFAEQHNTWKLILDLLHRDDFKSLDQFLSYLTDLTEEELKYYALPYLGPRLEAIKQKAVQGDKQAIAELTEQCGNHPFFPKLMAFTCEQSQANLLNHIDRLLRSWFDEVIKVNATNLEQILQQDRAEKEQMLVQLTDQQFIKWILAGSNYSPDSSVTKVCFIPQVIYRPWVIQTEQEGMQIFYYPVSDQHLLDHYDRYQPAFSMVQRYKALADENRLRLVKLIYENSRTLKELTDLVNLGKTTIHHHLALLRSARIIRLVDRRYVINKDLIGIESEQLLYYLENNKGVGE
ncbi:ArsR/SmtB family transcription factor [Amphibacillus sediminis]|uniref:ArsR/SmtB family transcription factor n=1 Tax=Amphibacillus sediminis TaxID=360185 RepID=UPI000831378E|nr:winged helix-turn-helix domain-containing protein [Amphibacillus sediminis]